MLKKSTSQQKNRQKRTLPQLFSRRAQSNFSGSSNRKTKVQEQLISPLAHGKKLRRKKRKRSFKKWVTGVFGKKDRKNERSQSSRDLSEKKLTFRDSKSTKRFLHVSLSISESAVIDERTLSTQKTKTVISGRNYASKPNYISPSGRHASSNRAKQERVNIRRRKSSVNSRPRYPYVVTRRSSRTHGRKRRTSSSAKKSISSQLTQSSETNLDETDVEEQVFEDAIICDSSKARHQCYVKPFVQIPPGGNKEPSLNEFIEMPLDHCRNHKKRFEKTVQNDTNLKHIPNICHPSVSRSRSEGLRNAKRRAKLFLSLHSRKNSRKMKQQERSLHSCQKVSFI